MAWIRCRDYSRIDNHPEATTLCQLWKPGLDNGRQRDFYPGVVNDIFSVYKRLDKTEQYVVQVNSAALIDTEGYHYVSLLDINPAAHTHEPRESKAEAFQRWRSQFDPNKPHSEAGQSRL
jgi:hypothetical protein